MGQRVKGQETVFRITGPSGIEDGLVDVTSLELEFVMEILTDGFLGETSDRKDDIFKSVRGRMDGQIESSEFFRFIERVKDRAQRRTPAAEQFSCLTRISIPNGETPRILFSDLFFGSIPISTGSREEFTTFTLDFEASEGRII